MTKKQFKKVILMHKDGISMEICIASIIELCSSSIMAAENIVNFYFEVYMVLPKDEAPK